MSEIENLFEKASRLQFRFETHRGNLSVEDLWGLPLTSQTGKTGKVNLDDIARGLFRQMKEAGEELSFITPAVKADEIPRLKLDLVKHIITVLMAERDAAAQAALKREQKQRILELIARKKDEDLAGRSLDELLTMVEQL